MMHRLVGAGAANPRVGFRSVLAEVEGITHFHQESCLASAIASDSHSLKGFTSFGQQPDVKVWVVGEIYNLTELKQSCNLAADNFAELLAEACSQQTLSSVLAKVDGSFSACIYAVATQQLHLVSDRYGSNFLYWYYRDGFLCWGSEVKDVLSHPEVKIEIDKDAFQCFMDLGYQLQDQTWFSSIKLMEPATIVSFQLQSAELTTSRYWSWAAVKQSSMSFDDAVNELGGAFENAVKRRFDPNQRIGVSLSGGLDSRAIVAAVAKLYPDYNGVAYTFGVPGCSDIQIAEQVCKQAGWKHQAFYFSQGDWFEQRVPKIWHTDGLQDIKHMHGCEFLPQIKQLIDVNLNGYAGDAIAGGGFVGRLPVDQRATAANTGTFFKQHADLINLQDPFYSIEKCEPVVMMNRVRRFTTMGLINSMSHIHQRMPFLDNEVMELIYSLPDAYRQDNRLYSVMLKRFYPDFFVDIAWQKTGKPVGLTPKKTFFYKALRKLNGYSNRLFKRTNKEQYTDYPNWIRDEKVAARISAILSAPDAQYKALTNVDYHTRYFKPHLDNRLKDFSDPILRAVTVEIYLRQVSEFRKQQIESLQ